MQWLPGIFDLAMADEDAGHEALNNQWIPGGFLRVTWPRRVPVVMTQSIGRISISIYICIYLSILLSMQVGSIDVRYLYYGNIIYTYHMQVGS